MFSAKHVAILLAVVASATSQAAPTAIDSYDISGAPPSDFGAWSHTYTGTISGTILGTTYTGGSGTLNDNIVPTSEHNNQLFLFSGNPTITLHLAESTKVATIDILGGITPDNAIPGTLKGWSVTIADKSTSLLSVGFNPQCFSGFCDNRVSLVGTGLEDIYTQTIVLSQFQGVGGNWPDHFSAGEIVVNSTTSVSNVPEPHVFSLAACALCLALFARSRGLVI